MSRRDLIVSGAVGVGLLGVVLVGVWWNRPKPLLDKLQSHVRILGDVNARLEAQNDRLRAECNVLKRNLILLYTIMELDTDDSDSEADLEMFNAEDDPA